MSYLLMMFVMVNVTVDYNDPNKENPVKSFSTMSQCKKAALKANGNKAFPWRCIPVSTD